MSVKQDNNPPLISWGMPIVNERGILTQAAAAFMQGLYTRPNYIDMAWFMPGVLVAATQPWFRYPCPPDRQVKPLTVEATLNVAPTVSSATISIWRSAWAGTTAMPTIPGGKLFDITFFPGSNNGLVVATYPDQNFTTPETSLFVVINTIGGGVAGEDLFLVVRG